MQNIIISLGARYAAAFGLLVSQSKPDAVGVSEFGFRYFGATDEQFEDISFKWMAQGKQKEVHFGTLPFSSGDEYIGKIVAPPPLMSFSKSKKLIETPINGDDEMVVERWGTQQWEISIKGLLIDIENRQYPEKLIPRLHRMFRHNGVIEAIGKQFFDKNIKTVYFTDIDLQGVQGFQDTIQFSLTAKSINAVSFTLLNPNS